MTGRLRLAGVFFDVPAALEKSAIDFWADALGAAAIRSDIRDPYTLLQRPGQEVGLEVQRLGEGEPRIHVDFEADDPADCERDRRELPVRRHQAAVVCRSAEHHPRQSRPERSQAPHQAAQRRIFCHRYANYSKPRLLSSRWCQAPPATPSSRWCQAPRATPSSRWCQAPLATPSSRWCQAPTATAGAGAGRWRRIR